MCLFKYLPRGVAGYGKVMQVTREHVTTGRRSGDYGSRQVPVCMCVGDYTEFYVKRVMHCNLLSLLHNMCSIVSFSNNKG